MGLKLFILIYIISVFFFFSYLKIFSFSLLNKILNVDHLDFFVYFIYFIVAFDSYFLIILFFVGKKVNFSQSRYDNRLIYIYFFLLINFDDFITKIKQLSSSFSFF